MKKIIIASFALYMLVQTLSAQIRKNTDSIFINNIDSTEMVILDTAEEEISLSPRLTQSDFVDILDQNLYEWALGKMNYAADCKHNDDPAIVFDSVYIARLKRLPFIMEMPYNDIVRNWIDHRTVRRRGQTEVLLGMSAYYFPIFEQILEANNMPLELKYLSIIESALHPDAVSPMGAAGLWQFMVATGRYCGLEINSLVDERLDPIKSTYAAAKYLKELYEAFGNWHLAIAAYNCGPGSVRKAIARSGDKRDYWAIYPYLPNETRGYVPAFIGAAYAFEYHKEHNLCPLVPPLPPIIDTVQIHERIHLEQISGVLNISYEDLKRLNPQYKKDIIPGSVEKNYTLCLPLHYLKPFITQYDSILRYRKDELIDNRRSEIEIAQKMPIASRGGKTTYHVVKKGQTLGAIAQRHGVSVAQLKRWNGLHSNSISTGQKLKIVK